MFKLTSETAFSIAAYTAAANNAVGEQVDSHYTLVAQILADLCNAGDEAGIHTILSTSQGQCSIGAAWNIVRARLTSALKKHSILFPKARNYTTGKGAFVLETKATADARKSTEEDHAKKIAAESAAEQVAAKEALDAATTARDLAENVIEDCARLNLSVDDVMKEVIAILTEKDSNDLNTRIKESEDRLAAADAEYKASKASKAA